MRFWIAFIASLAGLYGAAGVALAAAGAHLATGSLATTAADFLLFHAAALVAICTAASRRSGAVIPMIAASLIALGALLFSGHLALHALLDRVPLPYAAPIGGTLTILGWLTASVGLPLALTRAASTAKPIISKELRTATPGSSTTG